MARITVEQDAHGQHAVIVDGRVFARHHSLQAACAIVAALRHDIARHGESVIDLQSMPRAEYRTTAAGKRMMLA